MKNKFTTLFYTALLGAVSFGSLRAQTISTVAGRMVTDGIAATAAALYNPQGLVADNAGNIYFTAYWNNRIRKISASGVISTIAGNERYDATTGDGGLAINAGMHQPTSIAIDTTGNIYFCENSMYIRKINTAGVINTIAGNGNQGYSGDGGPATAASLNNPWGIAVDKTGNIYFSDYGNSVIRKINTVGIISTIAGNDTSGYSGDGGPATAAKINSAFGICLDTLGNLFFADASDNVIRKVNTTGIISTIAGTGTAGYGGDGGAATASELNYPRDIASDNSGNLYVADRLNSRIRKINSAGIITTIAGIATAGSSGDGGPATAAGVYIPYALTVSNSGKVYFIDACINADYSEAIREINTTGIISTIAGNRTFGYNGDGIAATTAELGSPAGVCVDSIGNIYIAEQYNFRIRKINTAGIISTFAGNGNMGYTGDGGAATAASLNSPWEVRADHSGNIYFADGNNNCIRKVSTSGVITTFAGNGTAGYTGDGGLANAAQLNTPNSFCFDNLGNMFIADANNNCIRKVNTLGIITTVAGNDTAGYSGDGGPATAAKLYFPSGVAVDNYGNIFIPDEGNNCVRKVDSAGTISTFAGTGALGYSGDGGPATAAQFSYPVAIVVDLSGNKIIIDYYNNVVRKINNLGIISTIAGNDTSGYYGDGGPATNAALRNPCGLGLDYGNNLYIADPLNMRIRKVTAPVIVPIIDHTNAAMVHLYPNPAKESFNVTVIGEGNEITITLLDISGKVLGVTENVQNAPNKTASFQTKGFAAGVYLVNTNIDGKVYNAKVVIMER